VEGFKLMKTLLSFDKIMRQRFRQLVTNAQMALRGFTRHTGWKIDQSVQDYHAGSNPLRAYFDSHREGKGIWKWDHYFEIYDHHFQRFVGQEVHVLEIGIYSGGSLEMWKHYFGAKAKLYGVDIEESCKVYEDDSTKVFCGDQEDRTFWGHFKREVPVLDIVIDDGGHLPEQQIATLEEVLSHLRPGGIYVCEDVHGAFNKFGGYVGGMLHNLNDFSGHHSHVEDSERRIVCGATGFQSEIQSIHLYPFVVVIEKRQTPVREFVAPKRGTLWQPFIR
jgi:hypothetical protein